MLRRLARLVAAAGVVWVMPVHALGLGEIDVRSKLNQNFSASIPVIDSAPQELDSLQVVMANPADFERAGIERADYLASITLKLETGVGGTRVLVSSTKIAHEPFLNFLVEAHWQGGRLLREYTVLLDPPNLPSSQTAAAIAPAAPATPEVTPAPAIAATPEPAPMAESPTPDAAAPMLAAPVASAPPIPVAESVKPAAASQEVATPKKDKAASTASGTDQFSSKTATEISSGAKTYGPVDPTETLWGIAGRVRPEAASTDQTLLALGLANPEAFDHGLFNGLLKGVTLKVPSDAAIESVPPNVAAERIAQWRKGGKLAAESSKAAAAAPSEKPARPAAAKLPEPSAAVPSSSSTSTKAVPANVDSTNKSAKGPSLSPGSSSVLPTGPVPAPSVPAPLPSTNPAPATSATVPAAALTSTVTPAAAGALTSSATPTPSSTPAATSPAPAAASAPTAVTPESPPAVAAASTTGGDVAGATTGSAAPSIAAPVTAPVQAASSGGSSAWFWILLLLVALIVFVVFRSKRAKKPAAAAPLAMSPPMNVSSQVAPAPKSATPASLSSPGVAANVESSRTQSASPAVVKAPVETRPFSEADPVFEPIAEVAPAKAASIPAPISAKIDSQIGASDPLSEADFHLAYGLHDEAANLLRRGIESDPTRKDLRVKLAEVYFAARKAAEFQQTAVPLRGQIAASDWQKLAALGRQIAPDVAAFRDDADAAEIAPPRSASPVPSAPSAPPSSNLLDFNFDEPAKLASSAAPAKSSNLLDFDFDAELASLQPTSLNKSMASAPDLSPHEFDLSQEMQDSKVAASLPAVDAPVGGEVDLSQSFPEGPLSAGDEIGTKLDLARAYADMGDNEAATELLREVALAGNASQMQEAEALAKRLRSA